MLSSIIESPSLQQAKRQTLWNVVLDFWTLTWRDCSSFVEPLQQKPCQNQTKTSKTSYQNSTKMHLKIIKIHSKWSPGGHLGHFGPNLRSREFPKVIFLHIWGHFGHPWGPLGTHLAPLWSTLGSQGSHFGALWAPLGWLWATSENRNIMMRILHFRPLWGSVGCHFSSKFQ